MSPAEHQEDGRNSANYASSASYHSGSPTPSPSPEIVPISNSNSSSSASQPQSLIQDERSEQESENSFVKMSNASWADAAFSVIKDENTDPLSSAGEPTLICLSPSDSSSDGQDDKHGHSITISQQIFNSSPDHPFDSFQTEPVNNNNGSQGNLHSEFSPVPTSTSVSVSAASTAIVPVQVPVAMPIPMQMPSSYNYFGHGVGVGAPIRRRVYKCGYCFQDFDTITRFDLHTQLCHFGEEPIDNLNFAGLPCYGDCCTGQNSQSNQNNNVHLTSKMSIPMVQSHYHQLASVAHGHGHGQGHGPFNLSLNHHHHNPQSLLSRTNMMATAPVTAGEGRAPWLNSIYAGNSNPNQHQISTPTSISNSELHPVPESNSNSNQSQNPNSVPMPSLTPNPQLAQQQITPKIEAPSPNSVDHDLWPQMQIQAQKSARNNRQSTNFNNNNNNTNLDKKACPICGKVVKSQMSRHLKIHSGAKPFPCEHCGRKFTRADHLTSHMNTHSKEKVYVCPKPNCGREFLLNSSMHSHLRTHSRSENNMNNANMQHNNMNNNIQSQMEVEEHHQTNINNNNHNHINNMNNNHNNNKLIIETINLDLVESPRGLTSVSHIINPAQF